MAESLEASAPRGSLRQRRGMASRWRWVAFGVVAGALAIAAVAWPERTPSMAPSGETVAVSPVIEAVAPGADEPMAPVEAPAAGAVESPAVPAAVIAAPASTGIRPVARPVAQTVRVRIPALGVDAPVQQMGFDAAGVMEVPQNAATVAWYGFTASPGNPGNAVMAAHVTWGGSRAVFNQLGALHAGDVIDIRTGDRDIRYVVQHSYLVRPEEADVRAIVGPREGPETLTLITCGGSFDSTLREYDHRVIVFATRL